VPKAAYRNSLGANRSNVGLLRSNAVSGEAVILLALSDGLCGSTEGSTVGHPSTAMQNYLFSNAGFLLKNIEASLHLG
jgi:hypothetical protein